MKYASLLLYSVVVLSLLNCNNKTKQNIENNQLSFQNTLPIKRVQEAVSISRKKLSDILGNIGNDSIPVVVSKSGNIIPFQLEDTDSDGNWDALLTSLDFLPNEIIHLEVKKISKQTAPSFQNETNVRFGVGKTKKNVSEVVTYQREGDPREKDSLFFQMEGPAWENDKVGFRFYFDPRNGIDIFGKTTSKMVLDKVGLHSNYHKLENWGMDVLKVGNSLGAGSIALKTPNGKLHRLTGIEKTTFNIITEGPVKSIFEMKYEGVKIEDQTINITHRVSIVKGQWGYKSELFFSGIKKPINLVSGIVNLKSNTENSEKFHNAFCLKSFGLQSENKDHLGMAILVNEQDYIKHYSVGKKETGISTTYLVEMKASNTKTAAFHFLAGWEKSNTQFSSVEGFDTMLKNFSNKINNPIVIK